MKNRIAFMGSPNFAIPILTALDEYSHVVGVITQPDRPAGRGRKLVAPAVKGYAEKRGIPVYQPRRIRESEATEVLTNWEPELIVVAAYGQILPRELLEFTPHGSINVHASLLPRWRGAAPIQAAILHGDAATGITLMQMDPGLDTGPIIANEKIQIASTDTGGTLALKLADLGADLLIKVLPDYLSGIIQLKAQDDSQSTYAPMLKKKDGELDFGCSAHYLARMVRAYNPWPGTFTAWKNGALKVHGAQAVEGTYPPGYRISLDGTPAVGTADGVLALAEVQPAGKKQMSGVQFLRGARGWEGDVQEG